MISTGSSAKVAPGTGTSPASSETPFFFPPPLAPALPAAPAFSSSSAPFDSDRSADGVVWSSGRSPRPMSASSGASAISVSRETRLRRRPALVPSDLPVDSDPDLALPDLGLAAAAEGFVAVAGGDDRLPRVRFEGASRVEAISAACREAASEASSAVVFERAGERDSGKKTSVGRRDGISVCASGMSACRPRPKPRFFWAITSPQRRRAR